MSTSHASFLPSSLVAVLELAAASPVAEHSPQPVITTGAEHAGTPQYHWLPEPEAKIFGNNKWHFYQSPPH